MDLRSSAPAAALGAAALFGMSTPAAKALLGEIQPWMLGGLLYLGSGGALGTYLVFRRLRGAGSGHPALAARDLPWLAGAIFAGGVAAPVLLMFGLARNVHDEHHAHAHAPQMTVTEPHSHWHEHEPLRHRHPHYPDVHHRHQH